MRWDELTEQQQSDLRDWFNAGELGDDDRQRLADLMESGKFEAWDCPQCGERVYCGDPDSWDHFQGVDQPDYTSCPGNHDKYQEDYLRKCCDDCRMSAI